MTPAASATEPGGFRIRPYRPDDREALYAVALATGRDGDDASDLFRDPTLLGHRYVGPYLDLEPDLAFTLEDHVGPCGYVLGAADTERFYRRLLAEWLPPLLERLGPVPTTAADEDERLLAELHRPTLTVPRDLDAYPAHLHIDLLPRAQGRGHGRRMMAALLDALVRRGADGVHLGVSPRNARAQGFYRALGFATVESATVDTDTVLMARTLS
jgi:ribosomal protein S18 acetylase RimI-like enzyme